MGDAGGDAGNVTHILASRYVYFVTTLGDDVWADVSYASFSKICIFRRKKGNMQSATGREFKDRQRLKELVEIYALRTRLLSEAIAVLGRDLSAGRAIDESMTKIKNLHPQVELSGADLCSFFEQRQGKLLEE